MLKVMLVRSRISKTPYQRRVLDALGLRKIRQVRQFKDNAAVRGMIERVSHLVEVVEE